MNTRKLTFAGLLIAVSVILVAFIHFPIFPNVAFLEYDPADIPILIISCTLGPIQGLVVTAAVAIIQGVTVSAGSGVYGIIMHFISTATFVLVTSLLYHKKKTSLSLGISLSAGTLAVTAIMIPANLFITPYFMGAPISMVVSLLPFIVLFNLIKSVINALLTFVIYIPLQNPISKILK